MRASKRTARYVFASALLPTALTLAGCQSAGPHKVAAAAEPGLSGAVEPGATVVEAPVAPARTVTFVDRHPLFFKPRDYYESSGNNKVVKAAAATMIGIPVGLYGELKQIVVGTPVQSKY
jgi:hypothetical protein